MTAPATTRDAEPVHAGVTFVDPDKVRRKRDPGRCFLRAGFVRDGETKGGLLAFRMSPEIMAHIAPMAPHGAQTALALHRGALGTEGA